MALTDEGGVGMTMPVSPMYGGGNGFGFGGDWAWIILLLLLGWGNNGWGNGAGGYGNGAGFVDASVQRGFDQSAIMSSLGDIQGAEAERLTVVLYQEMGLRWLTNCVK